MHQAVGGNKDRHNGTTYAWVEELWLSLFLQLSLMVLLLLLLRLLLRLFLSPLDDLSSGDPQWPLHGIIRF